MIFLLPCPDHPEAQMDLNHFEYKPFLFGDIMGGQTHHLIIVETCRMCGKIFEFSIPIGIKERDHV